MPNPFPANFETPGGSGRLTGQVNFTDPANQPGATFNGGTITNELEVAPVSSLLSFLLLVSPPVGFEVAGGAALGIGYSDASQAMRVGLANYGGGNHVGLNLFDGTNFNESVSINSDQGVTVQGDASLFLALRDNTSRAAAIGPSVGVLTAVNAAPADADLNAGECALWFDQTNGASKLMIKGKQANGTVKTAAVALA